MNNESEPPDIPSQVVCQVKGASGATQRSNENAQGVVEVVSVERPAAYGLTELIRKWRSLIDADGGSAAETNAILYDSQLIEIPYAGAGRASVAKIRRHSFPWGRAIMFLTTGYTQGPTGDTPVNSDSLQFIVQGFTNDGRYAVSCHFGIRQPRLPESADDKKLKGKVIFNWDKEDKEAAKWLDTQADDSFEPTPERYETFLESLRIEPPGRR